MFMRKQHRYMSNVDGGGGDDDGKKKTESMPNAKAASINC